MFHPRGIVIFVLFFSKRKCEKIKDSSFGFSNIDTNQALSTIDDEALARFIGIAAVGL